MTNRERRYHKRRLVCQTWKYDIETKKIILERMTISVPKSKFHKAIERGLRAYQKNQMKPYATRRAEIEMERRR